VLYLAEVVAGVVVLTAPKALAVTLFTDARALELVAPVVDPVIDSYDALVVDHGVRSAHGDLLVQTR